MNFKPFATALLVLLAGMAVAPAQADPGQGVATSLMAGQNSTCVVVSGGNVNCWGGGHSSQAYDDYDRKDAVSGDVSDANLCVLTLTGNVDCDGWNNVDGRADDYTGGDAVSVAVAPDHTCILLASHNVRCQGASNDGQSNWYEGLDAKAVSVGHYRTCILKLAGNVYCYGYSAMGSNAAYNNGDATALSVGDLDTCIVKVNRNVQCWGDDGFGQTNAYLHGDAKAVAVGFYHVCILKTDGNVVCQGQDTTGYSGGDATAIVAGDDHTCVLRSNGFVTCWDVFGQVLGFEAPSAPLNVRAGPGSIPGSVKVEWDSPSQPGTNPITGYNIYKGASRGTETLVKTVASNSHSYNDQGTPDLTPRYYKVTAVNEAGESPYSNEVSAYGNGSPSTEQACDAAPNDCNVTAPPAPRAPDQPAGQLSPSEGIEVGLADPTQLDPLSTALRPSIVEHAAAAALVVLPGEGQGPITINPVDRSVATMEVKVWFLKPDEAPDVVGLQLLQGTTLLYSRVDGDVGRESPYAIFTGVPVEGGGGYQLLLGEEQQTVVDLANDLVSAGPEYLQRVLDEVGGAGDTCRNSGGGYDVGAGPDGSLAHACGSTIRDPNLLPTLVNLVTALKDAITREDPCPNPGVQTGDQVGACGIYVNGPLNGLEDEVQQLIDDVNALINSIVTQNPCSEPVGKSDGHFTICGIPVQDPGPVDVPCVNVPCPIIIGDLPCVDGPCPDLVEAVLDDLRELLQSENSQSTASSSGKCQSGDNYIDWKNNNYDRTYHSYGPETAMQWVPYGEAAWGLSYYWNDCQYSIDAPFFNAFAWRGPTGMTADGTGSLSIYAATDYQGSRTSYCLSQPGNPNGGYYQCDDSCFYTENGDDRNYGCRAPNQMTAIRDSVAFVQQSDSNAYYVEPGPYVYGYAQYDCDTGNSFVSDVLTLLSLIPSHPVIQEVAGYLGFAVDLISDDSCAASWESTEWDFACHHGAGVQIHKKSVTTQQDVASRFAVVFPTPGTVTLSLHGEFLMDTFANQSDEYGSNSLWIGWENDPQVYVVKR